MTSIMGLFPTRVGYTVTPLYGAGSKEEREMRRKAYDAQKAKRLRTPYYEYTKVGLGDKPTVQTKEQAKALADKEAARFTRITGFKWTATECMY